MPDCDWVLYKQMRGQALPERFQFAGSEYVQSQLFKRDFYAATGAFRKEGEAGTGPERVVLKIYHTDRWGWIPLRWLGRMLWRREMRFGRFLGEVPGVAHVIGRFGETGLVREYVPGTNLREFLKTSKPDDKFFPVLKGTLAGIHAQGIVHNDLSKPENILVRPDGTPVLIDFQIALKFPIERPLAGFLTRPILRYMQGTDRYHLGKHQRRHRPQDLTPAEMKEAYRKGVVLTLHDYLLRRPYRFVRHLILDNFLRVEAKK